MWHFLILKRTAKRLACVLPVLLYGQSIQADTLFGGDSFAVECYVASQAAVASGSSNRADLDVCTRAIEDANLPVKSLIGSFVNRGVIYMAMGKSYDALNDLNRALSLDKDTGEAYVNRGNLWFVKGKLEQAIKDYDLAIELGVLMPHIAYLNRGIARESLGQLSAAQRDYKAALLIKDEWPEAISRLNRVNNEIQQELKKRESRKRTKAS